MKSTLLPFVTMMTLLFLLPTGCRKDDSVSQPELADEQLMRDFLSDDYFATASEYYNPSQADPSAQTTTESRTKESMTAALKDYFAKNPKEVQNMTKDLGYPIWHHTTYAVDEDEEILHIPFAKTDKNKIESVLYVSKSKDQNKLSFNMVLRKDLEKFDREKKIKKNKKVNKKKEQFSSLSKEMAVTTVAYFEQVVFQQVDCALAEMMKDDNFKPDDKVESRECFYVSYSQTTDWYQYGGGNISFLGSSTSYGGQWVCIYTYAWGPDGNGSNTNISNGTGGTSGNGSTTTESYEMEVDDCNNLPDYTYTKRSNGHSTEITDPYIHYTYGYMYRNVWMNSMSCKGTHGNFSGQHLYHGLPGGINLSPADGGQPEPYVTAIKKRVKCKKTGTVQYMTVGHRFSFSWTGAYNVVFSHTLSAEISLGAKAFGFNVSGQVTNICSYHDFDEHDQYCIN